MGVTQEIEAYLRHQDYSLVVRRMLDYSLDIHHPDLMKQVIAWSRKYHAHKKKSNNAEPTPDFLEEAERLLQHLREADRGQTLAVSELLTARDIGKKYVKGNFRLKPISLSMRTGEIIGVVGENGNGKTTLLRCLAGQLAIDSGSVSYQPLQHPDQFDIRSKVAFIPQRIPRWYGNLKDNLHFSAAICGIRGEENDLMVSFMLERLDLHDYAELNWNQISSGYRTRFEIARILLQKPNLLILDEPLANLDINAQQTILTDLRFLAKSAHSSMGVLLSSQQLHEVEKIADTVYLIKQGECTYQTNTSSDLPDNSLLYVMEMETSASREQVIQVLNDGQVQVQFNGNYYTISSSLWNVQDMIGKMIQQKLPVTYFRDITHSTKRFF